MIDPVSKFNYPDAWVSACSDPEDIQLVREGLAVLTSDGSIRRRGFTTGTTAAAACKAAVLSSTGEYVHVVQVRTACGLEFQIKVEGSDSRAFAYKYPGDYPEDATAGLEFRATLQGFQDEVELEVGPGIGRWDRDTARFRKDSPAISETARACIEDSIASACTKLGRTGAKVRIEATDGEAVAQHTLNPRIGILGGISVLGSTGLVEPWDDHLGDEVMKRVREASMVVVTTGRVGLAQARLRYPDREVVLVGANIMEAVEARTEGLVLYGLPALIIKFIVPDVLKGTRFKTVEDLVDSNHGTETVHSAVAAFKSKYPGRGIVIIDREGKVLGGTE